MTSSDSQVLSVLFQLVIGLCAEIAEADPVRIDRLRGIISGLPTAQMSSQQQDHVNSALAVLDRLQRDPSDVTHDRQQIRRYDS